MDGNCNENCPVNISNSKTTTNKDKTKERFLTDRNTNV